MNFKDIILASIFGFILAIVLIVPLSYKQGQIDAMTGKQVYCLDAQYQWVNGEPVDGLKCESEGRY